MATLKEQLQGGLTGVPDSSIQIPRPADVGNKSDMVSVPKGLLEQLMNDVQNLKTGHSEIRAKRVAHHTAKVRLLDDKYPVMGVPKVWVENQGRHDEKTFCQISYQTEEGLQVKSMPYVEFLNSTPSYIVKILKQEAHEDIKSYGMKPKRNPDPVKFSDDGKAFTPGMVEDVVRTVEYVSTVRFNDGPLASKELVIENKWLNI